MKISFFKTKGFILGAYLVSAFLVSAISTSLILGSNYGFGDNLPNYYLFENPFNDRYGNVIERYLFFILFTPLFLFVCYIFTIIDSSRKKVFKNSVLKEVKKDTGLWMFTILFFMFIVPLFLLLGDYITVSVGYMGWRSDSYFPTGHLALFGLWILLQIVIGLNSKK